eukprot:13650431-Heterocapsa_arctica.AAC.1
MVASALATNVRLDVPDPLRLQPCKSRRDGPSAGFVAVGRGRQTSSSSAAVLAQVRRDARRRHRRAAALDEGASCAVV